MSESDGSFCRARLLDGGGGLFFFMSGRRVVVRQKAR